MDPKIKGLIDELKQAKQEGLTFQAAKERMIAKGYTEEELSSASYSFTYSDIDAPANKQPIVSTKMPNANSDELELMGNSILQDKERSSRVYAYFTVIPVVGFAVQAYRVFLNNKFHETKDSQYLMVQNYPKFIVITLVISLVWLCIIKLSFALTDHTYRRRNQKLK